MNENRAHTSGFSWLSGLLLVFGLGVSVGDGGVVWLGFLSLRFLRVKIEFRCFAKLVLIVY